MVTIVEHEGGLPRKTLARIEKVNQVNQANKMLARPENFVMLVEVKNGDCSAETEETSLGVATAHVSLYFAHHVARGLLQVVPDKKTLESILKEGALQKLQNMQMALNKAVEVLARPVLAIAGCRWRLMGLQYPDCTEEQIDLQYPFSMVKVEEGDFAKDPATFLHQLCVFLQLGAVQASQHKASLSLETSIDSGGGGGPGDNGTDDGRGNDDDNGSDDGRGNADDSERDRQPDKRGGGGGGNSSDGGGAAPGGPVQQQRTLLKGNTSSALADSGAWVEFGTAEGGAAAPLRLQLNRPMAATRGRRFFQVVLRSGLAVLVVAETEKGAQGVRMAKEVLRQVGPGAPPSLMRLAAEEEGEAARCLRYGSLLRTPEHGPCAALMQPCGFFDMAHLPGYMLRANGGVAAWMVAAVNEQISRALVHMHRRGYVHLDVHPGNVVVVAVSQQHWLVYDMDGSVHEEPPGIEVVLTDFEGCARLAADEEEVPLPAHAVVNAGYVSVRGQLTGTCRRSDDFESLALTLETLTLGPRPFWEWPDEADVRLERLYDLEEAGVHVGPPEKPSMLPELIRLAQEAIDKRD